MNARAFAMIVLLGTIVAGGAAWAETDHCPADGVDELLRRCQALHPGLALPIPPTGCRQHQRQLAEIVFADGRVYPWDDYARWGRELFDLGYAFDPPAGPFDPRPWPGKRRSRPISDFADYTCSRCHNDLREDPVLIAQDPAARFAYIRELDPEADYRATALKMTQGVTLWGGVNRIRFYNQHFDFFDSICVPTATTLFRSPEDPTGEDYRPVDCSPARFSPCGPGCRKIDTASFRDANQVCGRYCGVGRFMEDWELAALLTHFWTRQVLLADVVDSVRLELEDLRARRPPPAQAIAVAQWKLSVLEPLLEGADRDHPPAAACEALADSYLLTSCETLRDQSPADPDFTSCSRDWTPQPSAAGAPAGAAAGGAAGAATGAGAGAATGRFAGTDPEDLPAMIRHILGRSATPQALLRLQPPPAQPFLSDDADAPEPDSEALRRGKDLYELSCGRCHGASPEGAPQIGGRGHRFLVGSSYVFFELVAEGLTPKTPIPPNPRDPSQESLYMPEFVLERLSYQQVRDIHDYLATLPPSGDLTIQEPDSSEDPIRGGAGE